MRMLWIGLGVVGVGLLGAAALYGFFVPLYPPDNPTPEWVAWQAWHLQARGVLLIAGLLVTMVWLVLLIIVSATRYRRAAHA